MLWLLPVIVRFKLLELYHIFKAKILNFKFILQCALNFNPFFHRNLINFMIWLKFLVHPLHPNIIQISFFSSNEQAKLFRVEVIKRYVAVVCTTKIVLRKPVFSQADQFLSSEDACGPPRPGRTWITSIDTNNLKSKIKSVIKFSDVHFPNYRKQFRDCNRLGISDISNLKLGRWGNTKLSTWSWRVSSWSQLQRL